MEATTESTVVERELAIAAAPETIWKLLVDPAKATRWMGVAAELDARPGGAYRVEVLPGVTAAGEFVEVDPPRRLVWTWGWEDTPEGPHPVPPGSSTIEIDLIPDGSGTTLKFRHSGLRDATEAGKHAHGWEHFLDRLALLGGGGDPGPDPWVQSPPTMQG